MTLLQHIEELRAEVRGALTRRERVTVQAELAQAIAAQVAAERAGVAHDQSAGR